MKLKFIPILLSALTLGIVHAEEYTLAKKGFMPPAGTVYLNVNESDMKDGTVKVVQNDAAMEGTMLMKEKNVTAFEFINNKKIISTVTEHDSKQTGTMNGLPTPPENKVNHLLNKPVICELEGEKWVVTNINTFEDEAKKEALKEAEKITKNINTSIYGYEPRKIGEEWKADKEALKAILGDSEGIDKAKGSIQLISVEKIEGVNVATLKVAMQASGEVKEGLKISMEGPVTIKRDIDNFIDLEASGKLQMKAGGEQGPMTLTMGGNIDMKVTVSIKEAVTR